MDIVEIGPRLRMLLFDFGQAYLWRDADSLTLIDTGCVGDHAAVATAIERIGLRRADLDLVVLTHHHEDHTGSAAEFGDWDGVIVAAHRDEAPVIRGDRAPTPPVLTDAPDWERALYDAKPTLPPAPPARVDRELVDGDVLDFGGGATVLSVPGHTDGSIAIHLPAHGVLFTGDAVATVEGRAMLGVFNVDRARAADSLRRMATLGATTVCVGHGAPLIDAAPTALADATARL